MHTRVSACHIEFTSPFCPSIIIQLKKETDGTDAVTCRRASSRHAINEPIMRQQRISAVSSAFGCDAVGT